MPENFEQAKASLPFSKIEITAEIGSDGKVVAKILLNGKEIPDLSHVSLSFYNDGMPNPLFLSINTKDPEPKPGTLVESKYYTLKCPCPDQCCAAKATVAQVEKATATLQQEATVPTEALPRNVDRRKLYGQI